MSPNGKKLVVISMDAMITEDIDLAKTLPTYGHMIRGGALVKNVREIYPTLTYPSHVSMISGYYPDKHGVHSNFQEVPGCLELPWNWYHHIVKTKDLMDAAKKAGMTTASVSWPVTGRHEAIDYLVDEIWPMDPDSSANDYVSVFLGAGTPQFLMESTVAQHLELRMGRKHPGTAWFSTLCAADIIREYAPDVITIHLANIDNYRHRFGVYSPEVQEAVRDSEEMLRTIVEAVSYTGFLPVTDFAIVSDHGQIDVDRMACPNVLLRENGLITVDQEGKVTDCLAYSYSVDGSAHIVLKDPKDWETYSKVEKILKDACADGKHGIERVYSAQEVEKEEHLSGGFSFVIETDGRTEFRNDWTGDYFLPVPEGVHGKIKGIHGHHPDKGPNPYFLGYGPSFKEGFVMDGGVRLIDEAPTYARILGIKLPADVDGKPVLKMLRE